MKVASANATRTEQHGALTSLGDVGIGAESIAKLFSIITERMYEDPIRAFTRELMTNMVDAHLQHRAQHGMLPLPGLVSLPTSTRGSVKFYDHGPGMSEAEITDYVCHILRSSKDQSNEFHGGWGLGMKSPFSYTRQWSLTSRQNGMATSYATFMQESGIPSVSQLGSPVATDEPDGLTVEVPVKRTDWGTVADWVEWWMHYLPEGFIESPGLVVEPPDYDEHWQGTVSVDDHDWRWYVRRQDTVLPPDVDYKNRMRSPEHNAERVRIVLGSVPYLRVPGLGEHPHKQIPVDIHAPIGSLNVTPDRDRLSATEDQTDRINRVVEAVGEQLAEVFAESIADKRPYISIVRDSDNDAYRRIRERAFKAAESRALEHEGYKFEVRTSGAGYQFPAYQLTAALRQYTELSEHSEIELRRRSYEAPSQVHSLPLAPHYWHNIDYTLDAIYYDDVGSGSVARFRSVHLPGGRGYYRQERSSYVMIYPTGARTRFTKFDEDEIALAMGVPAEMLKPISEVAAPASQSSARITVGKSTPKNVAEELYQHPLVKVLGFGRYTVGLSARDWPRNVMPDEGRHYYVATNKGRIEHSPWPYTTAAQAPSDWSGLSMVPRSLWDFETKPIVMLPGNLAREFGDLANWEPFFDAFDAAVLAWIERHSAGVVRSRVYSHQYIHGRIDPIAGVAAQLARLDHLARHTGAELPVNLAKRHEFFRQTRRAVDLLPSMPFWVNLDMPRLLGISDMRAQTRSIAAFARQTERQYPMLGLAAAFTERRTESDVPRNKEAMQHVIRSIARRAPQRSQYTTTTTKDSA